MVNKLMDTAGVGVVTVVGIFIIVAVVGLLVAFPIMWSWNAVMPYLFALPVITWGKAWCLYFLAGCLIKGSSTSSSK